MTNMRFSLHFSLLVAFIIAGSVAFGHRENTYYLEGQLGDKQVAFRLDEFGETCFARYFEFADRKDHLLEGTILQNNQFELHSSLWDSVKSEKTIVNTLRFHEVENHEWRGVWTTSAGIDKPVHLKPIVLDSLNHPYLKHVQEYPELQINPYTAYRTRDITFNNIKQQRISKGLSIQWLVEPVSGIRHFRVLAQKNKQVDVDRINEFLALEHIRLVDSKMSCITSAGPGTYSIKSFVHFLNSNYLSYTIKINSSCLGLSNESIIYHSTRSIKSSEKVMLEDVVWFDENTRPRLWEGSQTWYEYRYKIFGQKILELLVDLYPRKFKQKNKNCNYLDVKLWQFPNWYLTKKGLFLEPTSIYGKLKCNDSSWFYIPWKHLKTYTTGI